MAIPTPTPIPTSAPILEPFNLTMQLGICRLNTESLTKVKYVAEQLVPVLTIESKAVWQPTFLKIQLFSSGSKALSGDNIGSC